MKAKQWTILFISLIALCVVIIMGSNYIVDPFGYFRAQGGDCYELNELYYLREIKAQHIKNFSDEYDAYLIGGSKAGGIRTEKLKELDGYNYYNAWELSGNFQDYYYYTKYIVEHCKPKKILLHISTSELKRYNRESVGDIYEIPAEITGASKVNETFEFLFKNLTASVDEIKKHNSNDPADIIYPTYKTGERNLKKYYDYYQQNQDTYYDFLFKKKVDDYLPRLTKGPIDKTYVVEHSIADLKEIKRLCDEHDVELQVVVGTVFLGEQIFYEGESYYSFLEQLVQITGGVWSFNNYNDIMKNPFNYYDTYHYLYQTADLMIDTMTGKQNPEGFGVYLTMDNIEQHIKKRKDQFEEIKKYYNDNGQLPFLSYEDDSNYLREEKETFTDMLNIGK